MKYLIYAVLAFIAGLLFLPKTGTTQIRNLPLFILIISIALMLICIRFLKYIVLMGRTRRFLKKNGVETIKIKLIPWSSLFHGHYSVMFQHKSQTVQLILLSRKRKYQRYHFDSIERLEFYRANRVVFRNIKAKGAIVSNLVEVNQIGSQRIKWDRSATVCGILFDKLPDEITDSSKKENIGTGEHICNSEVFVLDWKSFSEKFIVTK